MARKVLFRDWPENDPGVLAALERMEEGRETLKREAAALGRELLTTKAASELFGLSTAGVRLAVKSENVDVAAFRIEAKGRSSARDLLWLDSCVENWGDPDQAKLSSMRENPLVMSVGNQGSYVVLDTVPLVTIVEPSGFGGGWRAHTESQGPPPPDDVEGEEPQ